MTDTPDRPGEQPGSEGQEGPGDQQGGYPQPGGYPQGEWGQQPGSVPPWPVPRPGIVPLAPLSGPDMLTGSLRFIRSHWLVTLVPSAVAMLVLTAAQVLLQLRLVSTLDAAQGGDPSDVLGPAFLTDVLLFGVVALVLGLVVFPLVLSMLYSVLVPAVLGRVVPFGQALREGLRRAPALLGLQVVTALIGLVVMGVGIGLAVVIGVAGDGAGVSILIAVLVGLAAYAAWIWISVTLTLAPPALVVERAGVGAALTRSRGLVRGAWWRCFGILLLTAVAAGAMGALISIPTSLLGAGTMMSASPGQAPSASSAYFVILGVGTWLVSSVALPFGVGVGGLIYVDRRMRTEGYAQELAARAGVPGA